DRGDQGAARLVSLARMPSNPIAIVQLASLILAALALIMGAYLLIIGKRPWREDKDERVAPRVRLLGLSYILVFGSAMVQIDRGDQWAARLVSLARMPSNPIAIVQLASLILAALALIMGAYLLIIGKRPWREDKDERVAPRVRLLGLSYILVFGSAMIQIVLE